MPGFSFWVERLSNGLRQSTILGMSFVPLPVFSEMVGEMVSDTYSDELGSASAVQSKRELGRIIVVSISGVVIMALILFYLSYSHHRQAADKLLIDPARDYSRVPFNMMDATEYCRQKTHRRYGDSLALSYIDNHSTRLDVKTGLYKIFMFARVGELHDYQEEAVHCFIDPERRVLTHYRTINLQKASLMSKASKFFERF